ncbi:hypothetical protein SAMN05192533_12532 [Mesobacillus persicus]|uniref:Helix-turn-helix domain-containing protein n=1 Tax=Mesobacillus persicus TaxID=930146 RepID=A0A1H8K897_9BACI|nr:hypothetical protein [Mesobacillus persicus]SEN89259.1 hypothetical protein SAMN05192533_12532 [Mesobacillus persicus]
MNLKTGSIDQFKEYSKFSSLKEFNTHFEMWMSKSKDELSKGELVALKRLVRFSAKLPGVSNAKIGTMLKAIHEEYNGNGISRSTFKRMILKATALGILTVHETERKNGSQSSNLYVFNRFPQSEPPKAKQMNHQYKASIPSKTNNKDIKERKETCLDYTYTSNRVPKPFIDLLKYFFPMAKTIEEFWNMTMIAVNKTKFTLDSSTILEIAIQSFKQLIGKMKSSTSVKNQFAYYYGILNKKLARHIHELFGNWLYS